MSNQLTTKDLVQRINNSWRKTTEGILETALLCYQANSSFQSSTDRRRLVEQLHFDQSTFSKLIRIGERQELHTERFRSALPGNYSVVYEVAKLDEVELETALEERVLKPDMTRNSLRNWVEQRKGSNQRHEQDAKPYVICTLETKQELDQKRHEALQKSLDELQRKYGLIVKRPFDREEQQLNSIDKKVLHRVRSRAQEFLDRMISQAKSKAASEGEELSAEALQFWWFSDEVERIPKDATWEEIRDHLSRLGHSDQFDRLVEEAMVLNGVTEDDVRGHHLADHEEAKDLLKTAILRTEPRAD